MEGARKGHVQWRAGVAPGQNLKGRGKAGAQGVGPSTGDRWKKMEK